MNYNSNSGYGAGALAAAPFTTGKLFVVAAASDDNLDFLSQVFKFDPDGDARLHTTFTLALAECVADRGDIVVVSPAFETALTAAELLAAETKGVTIMQSNADADGVITVFRATAALPATTAAALFTVTGRVELLQVLGVVTTIVQTQANNTKLIANPTVGADVDLCAVNDISADAVGTVYGVTGTLADAMVATTSGAGVKQADATVLEAGTLDLSCAATNTGSVKWMVKYRPLDPGARLFAA